MQKKLNTGFNPFTASKNRGDLSDLEYQTWIASTTDLIFSEISATGHLLDMAAGPVAMALGVQAHREVFHIDADEASKNDEVIGSAGGQLGGSRDIISSYAELSLPLRSNIEWNLSSRYDIYSDMAPPLAPKPLWRWQLSPSNYASLICGTRF